MTLSSKFKLEARLYFRLLICLLTHPFPQHCRQAPLLKHLYLRQSAGQNVTRVSGVSIVVVFSSKGLDAPHRRCRRQCATYPYVQSFFFISPFLTITFVVYHLYHSTRYTFRVEYQLSAASCTNQDSCQIIHYSIRLETFTFLI